MKKLFYKVIIFIVFIVFGLESCKKHDPITIDNYILSHKISVTETKELENKFGSQLYGITTDGADYKRLSNFDSIPFDVSYQFKADSVQTVEYIWSNLKGKKPEIDNRVVDLYNLLKERFNTLPDSVTEDREMTTRIDFDDYYYWKKNNSTLYSASLFFHESFRVGQSSLKLIIEF